MRAGIIAAGHGARLRAAGITTPKPLIEIGGQPLIARTIDVARHAGATSVACIVNAETDEVRLFLERQAPPLPVTVVQRTTPSSAASFLALRTALAGAPFLLLTVDSIVAAEAVRELVAFARARPDAAGVLGVTTTVDDEKPLWADLDASGRVRALGTRARYVTAGVYFLTPLMYALADASPPGRWQAFRALLGALLASGRPVYGFDVGPCIDVDRPRDIAAAERLLGIAGREDPR